MLKKFFLLIIIVILFTSCGEKDDIPNEVKEFQKSMSNFNGAVDFLKSMSDIQTQSDNVENAQTSE
jgi:outer membrane lipoprotein-sorting protein